jgi:hypothetical protein
VRREFLERAGGSRFLQATVPSSRFEHEVALNTLDLVPQRTQ